MVGSSRSRSDTSVETTQTSENLNVQDVEGITVADVSGNVSIVQTDHNAVGDATRLAQGVVDVAENINADSLDFASRVYQTGAGQLSEAYDRGLDFAEDAQGFAERALTKTQETITSAVDAVLAIGKEQNTSADQRVADIASGSQKNLIVLVGIVSVAALAFVIYRSR